MQRGYPPVPEEAFVALMEKVLDLYSQPYDARCPGICRDEHAKLLRANTRPPHPARPGCLATYDYEYARHGTCKALRVLIVAGRHALLALESTDAACHGMACPIPCRGVGTVARFVTHEYNEK